MADLSVMGFLNEETQQETEYNLKDAQARSDISIINSKIPSAASSSNKLVDTTAMNDAIGSAVSSAYHAAGSATVAQLTSSLLIAANEGNVYNMSDSGVTTADFVEGAGKPIRVGDDVGICQPTLGVYKFNLLSGFVAVDTNPTQSSANPVSSGGVYSELAGIKDGQSIDSFADVETALADKVDKVTGKGLSTNDYDNTAKGIVTTAQDNIKANTKLIKDTVGWSGKNLNVYPYVANSTSADGITATVDDDGSVKINGTATQGTSFLLHTREGYSLVDNHPIILPPGRYHVTKDLTKVGLRILDTVSGALHVILELGNDAFGGFFELEETTQVGITVNIDNGTVFNNDILHVMILDPNCLDKSYEPYHHSVKDILRDAEVIDGKNLVVMESNNSALVAETGNQNFYISEGNNGAFGVAKVENGKKYILSREVGNYFRVIGLNELPKVGLANKVAGAIVYEQASADVKSYEYTNSSNYKYLALVANSSGASSAVTAKIMVRNADETDPTYEAPYIPLKDSMFPRSEQAVLGAKNLLPPIITANKTVGTITYSVNSDGVITASGSTTEYAPIECSLGSQTSNYLGLKSGDSFQLSGCPSGGTLETFALWLRVYYTDNTDENFLDYGNGVTVTVASSKTVKGVRWGFYINRGNAPSTPIKPMLRLASDPDSTYVPYVMTNRELTDKKSNVAKELFSGSVTLSDTDAVVNLTEDYRKYKFIDVVLSDGWGNSEIATFYGVVSTHKNTVVALPALQQNTKIVRLRHDYTKETTAGMNLSLKFQQISGSEAITFDTPVSVTKVFGRN